MKKEKKLHYYYFLSKPKFTAVEHNLQQGEK